jgi:cell division transport system permease protein
MKSVSAYFYSIFATTLVLVVIGVVFALAYEARIISVSFKENLTVEVVLKDEAGAAEVSKLQAEIAHKQFVKKLTFVSKEQAAI